MKTLVHTFRFPFSNSNQIQIQHFATSQKSAVASRLLQRREELTCWRRLELTRARTTAFVLTPHLQHQLQPLPVSQTASVRNHLSYGLGHVSPYGAVLRIKAFGRRPAGGAAAVDVRSSRAHRPVTCRHRSGPG